MSKKEMLLELVLDKVLNIKEVLNNTKDIENFLNKLNETTEVDIILEKAKNLVNNVYDRSVELKKEFDNKYNEFGKLSTEKNNQNRETSIEDDTSRSEILSPAENLEGAVPENQTQENMPNICIAEHNEHAEEITDKEIDNENVSNHVEEDPLKDPESPDIVDSSITKNNDKENTNITEETKSPSKEDICDIKQENRNSLIRLVDLSKLIDPKQKKSVKFDSSIIILTSSDEENKTPKKKEETSYLKSALKPNLDTDVKASKNGKDLSDKKKKRRSSKRRHSSESEESNSNVAITKIQNNKEDKRNEKSSSDSSDEVNSREKAMDKSVKKNKDYEDNSTNSDIKSQHKDVNQSKTINNSKSENDTSDDEKNEECEKSFRKSSRLQTKNITKKSERDRFKKLFHRKSTKASKKSYDQNEKLARTSSDSDSDSSVRRKSSGKHSQNKKKDLREEQLSDVLSLSSNDDDDVSTGNVKDTKIKEGNGSKAIVKTNESIDKFKCEVYVPLPRIECMRMKEIYLKNQEIFEIRRLSVLNLQRSHKRNWRVKKVVENSSSDGEKPQRKKSKNSTSKKKQLTEKDVSSNEEPSKDSADNDPNSVDEGLKENTNNKDEQMAEIVMDALKDSNEAKSDSDNIESEVEVEKNSKTKEKIPDLKNTELGNESDKEIGSPVNENQKDENKEKENEDEKKKSSENDSGDEKRDNAKEKDNEDESDDKKKNEDTNGSDDQKKEKKKWRKDKLLTIRIDSTDSEEEQKKYSKKKEKSKNDSESDTEDKSPILNKRKAKKRVRKAILSSDSEGSNKEQNDNSDNSSKSSSSDEANSDKDDDKKEEESKNSTRKRIKRTKESSSSDDDKSTRKQIRRVIGRDSLSETTKQAEAEEKERKARIAEKQKKYNHLFEATAESKVDKVVLDYDEEKKKDLISVSKNIVKKLKPHQASGIQFMWDACFESIKRAKSTKGSGCILAHCMGLGKTLQVIALSHTLLTNEDLTGVRKVMVVCPINTVLNWKSEFKQWMPKSDEFEVHELVSCKQNYERQYIVNEWHTDGGVLIIGYTMFRNLSNPDNKRLSKKFRNLFNEALVDPGPDLVVCDEGHLLKNEKTHLSIAMNRIKTARRIVLTGTPLQNNLKEYWCMVQFIKPNLLGTFKEYLNRFVNPITNGQYTDSTQHDILLMRKRSHVLHKLLDGVVQRRDYAVLEPYLPPKQEYVLFIKLTETQVKLYKHYMDNLARQNDGSNRTSFLFADFQELQRICTHPRVLLDKSKDKREKEFEDEEDSEGSLKDFIDDDDEESSASSSGSSSDQSNSDSDDSHKKKKNKSKGKQQKVRVTRAQAAQRRENNEESDLEPEVVENKQWFQQYCDGEEFDNINNSGKLFLLFQILKECEDIGDKVLVFSQSLYTLNCIEYFLEKIDEATQNGNSERIGDHTGSWSIGLDYFRLDGSSSCDNRATWCNMFNNPKNTRARLFLISTKAGGLGINLVAANRVIIFDVSWNPSHDIQSIYRVYRFGQTKPCYIYRFVSYGTMEMKIYERQVTKQAISKRVIDEQQIDRHYNQNDLQELYQCDLEPADRPIPMVPKDVLLGEMLQKYENTVFKYHLHQSLLENKTDEGLNEEERKAAWEEFENEKVLRKNTGMGMTANAKVNAQAIETALASIVRKDNPTWSDVQIRGIIPALVQQLQVQLTEGDMTMYTRVQQEIQILQEIQAQKFREAYYQQQVMRMIQSQQQQAKLMGNMYIDPNQFGRIPGGNLNVFGGGANQGGPSTAPQSLSNDVIELND